MSFEDLYLLFSLISSLLYVLVGYLLYEKVSIIDGNFECRLSLFPKSIFSFVFSCSISLVQLAFVEVLGLIDPMYANQRFTPKFRYRLYLWKSIIWLLLALILVIIPLYQIHYLLAGLKGNFRILCSIVIWVIYVAFIWKLGGLAALNVDSSRIPYLTIFAGKASVIGIALMAILGGVTAVYSSASIFIELPTFDSINRYPRHVYPHFSDQVSCEDKAYIGYENIEKKFRTMHGYSLALKRENLHKVP